jgi:hypothetical protein
MRQCSWEFECFQIGTPIQVAATRRAWDYLTTTSMLHLALACAVTRTFPTNWIWWATLLPCTAIAAAASEVLIYRLKDMRDIQLNH